jgi:hypothetical protein
MTGPQRHSGEKRYSLMMEGNRWVDMRVNKLSALPLDIAPDQAELVPKVMPIPQAECLNRIAIGGAMVGPNGQNNCN